MEGNIMKKQLLVLLLLAAAGSCRFAHAMLDQKANDELLFSAQTGDLDGVKKALSEGADVNYEFTAPSGEIRSPLTEASGSETESLEVVLALLAARANVNHASWPDDETPLLAAIKEGNYEIAQALLTAGAGVNARNSFDNKTPLMVAAYGSFCSDMQLLLEHKADVTARDYSGDTPLLLVTNGDEPQFADDSLHAVKLLLKHNADIDDENNSGITALMFACANGNQEIVTLLLETIKKQPEHENSLGLASSSSSASQTLCNSRNRPCDEEKKD